MNLKNNPELLPLVEWWEKDGKSTVIWLIVAAIAVGGWYGWKNHRAAMLTGASDALVSAGSVEELEQAVSKFDGWAAQGPLKIRLAKGYYDDGRYQEAMAIYDELIAKPVEGFEDVPAVGRIQCQEALGSFKEAQTAFDAFVEANPKSYLRLTAQLGAVRCLCQAGDRKAALSRLETLKQETADDEIAKARVEATEKLVVRFEQKPAAK